MQPGHWRGRALLGRPRRSWPRRRQSWWSPKNASGRPADFREDTFGDEHCGPTSSACTRWSPSCLRDGAQSWTQGGCRSAAAKRHQRPPCRSGHLDDPAVTMLLLRQNAVVGVRGGFSRSGQLESIGVTCALCHSTVDDSLTKGIGRRLDGWAATDLNVGAIVALSPALDTMTKAEFNKWGPGKYDPRHHAFNGANIVPLNSPSLPVVIPPIDGLRGVDFETYTADGPFPIGTVMSGSARWAGRYVRRSAYRPGDSAVARPGRAEAAGPARLPIELAHAVAAARQFHAAAAGRGRGIFNRACGLPSAAKFY